MKATLKMKLISLVLTLVLAICCAELKAQPYLHSVGIRAGFSSGLSYKGFRLHRMGAIEGNILYNRHGFNLSALYEQHWEPFRNERILLFLGGGAFGGEWDEEFSLGAVAVAGIEYTFRDQPINIGLDWRPMLNVYRTLAPEFLDFGLCIRYRFGK